MEKEKNIDDLKSALMKQLRKDIEIGDFDHALYCVDALKKLEEKKKE